MGAAWLRTFPADDPGFGFVAADVPELAIGVLPAWRGRGIGTRLLRAVVAGAARVSLSVERANPAVRLYVREGFVAVDVGENSMTMVLDQ